MIGSMMDPTRAYSVQELANMAGVTARTLHYYDQIGLLPPGGRTDAGYRLYGKQELLRLQAILFYRELGFELSDIKALLLSPEYERLGALRDQRRLLESKRARLGTLVETIDKTIRRIQEEDIMLSDQELYEGFSQDEIDSYKREARQRYGAERVETSEQRIKRLSAAEWKAVQEEGGEVAKALAEHIDEPADSPAVQSLIDRHHAWIENFYPAPAEVYAGLGRLYTEDERFRAFYDRIHAGLADFIKAGIDHYCQSALANQEGSQT
jgi:DNA-binding transcriptional MerR regulator